MGIFDVYVKKPKRNNFPLSFNNFMTIQDFGTLYPILMKPAVPGDVFKHAHAINLTFEPMYANVNHRFRVCTYYFFVPNRIIWPQWDEFISNNPNGSPLPVHPYMLHEELHNYLSGGTPTSHLTCPLAHGSLADYISMATCSATSAGYALNWTFSDGEVINSLPFRAYQKIFNEYFNDEQSGTINCYDGFDNNGQEAAGMATDVPQELISLRSKAWNKDPFTSSLIYRTAGNYTPTVTANPTFTIEDLRNANTLTRFFERMMRAGTRPMEFLHATFGVKPKDYRLDMPEFLTASSSDIILGHIMNAQASTGQDDKAQGYIVSTARSSSVAGGFHYRCREFGWYVGLLALVPDAVYYRGMPKYFTDFMQPTDYPFPDFATLGDQAIKAREVNWLVPQSSLDDAENKNVFGYAPRYWEYKYYPNELHGLFRENAYEQYHDARQVANYTPNRQTNFVYIQGQQNGLSYPDGTMSDKDNLKRIFNISSGAFIAEVNVFHKISGLRPFPYSSVPRLIG